MERLILEIGKRESSKVKDLLLFHKDKYIADSGNLEKCTEKDFTQELMV
jgi:hypothetical protein